MTSTVGTWFYSSVYGQGSGPVFASYLGCTGNEWSLLRCSRTSIFSTLSSSCTSHYYDVQLKCERMYHHSLHVILFNCIALCTNGTVRIQDSFNKPMSGEVEVCVNGTWSTICPNYWDNNDASVICKQLGYSPYGNT